MLLITEYLEDTTSVIQEEKNGKKNLYIEGIFMQAEQKNRNGRIYPRSILESEVNRYVNEYVKTNRALGELNHPQSPVVDPERASHRITELRSEGNNFIGKALVLDTPMGNIVRGLIEGGTRMGVSSRGLGTLKARKDGVNEVQKDYRFICVDVVSDPSAPDAFVNGIMEGHNWIYDNGRLVEQQAEKVYKLIKKTPKAKLAEVQAKAFEEFINSLA